MLEMSRKLTLIKGIHITWSFVTSVHSLVKCGSAGACGACKVTRPIAVSDSRVTGSAQISSVITCALSSSLALNRRVVSVVNVGNRVANTSDSSAECKQGKSFNVRLRKWRSWRIATKYSGTIEDIERTCKHYKNKWVCCYILKHFFLDLHLPMAETTLSVEEISRFFHFCAPQWWEYAYLDRFC